MIGIENDIARNIFSEWWHEMEIQWLFDTNCIAVIDYQIHEEMLLHIYLCAVMCLPYERCTLRDLPGIDFWYRNSSKFWNTIRYEGGYLTNQYNWGDTWEEIATLAAVGQNEESQFNLTNDHDPQYRRVTE